MKKVVSLLVLSSFFLSVIASRSYAYLTIDTNKILKEIQNNPSITNIPSKPIIEEELPNSYLATGLIKTEPPRDPGRRFDVVFFVSIPITFYLLLNIMQWRNMYFNNGILGNTDWTYIYLNTFFVPLATAYFDYQYIEKQMKYRQEMALYQDPIKDFFSLKLPVFSFKF